MLPHGIAGDVELLSKRIHGQSGLGCEEKLEQVLLTIAVS
jgi:hypothetical protein